MKSKNDTSLSLKRDTRGLSSVEYLILLVVIAVASLGIWKKIGGQVSDRAQGSSDALDTIPVP